MFKGKGDSRGGLVLFSLLDPLCCLKNKIIFRDFLTVYWTHFAV